MAGPFRDKVRKAREILNAYMSVGAFYFALPDDGSPPVVREIDVRVHDKFLRVGDLAGTNFHYAEMEENSPRAIFMRAVVEPTRGYYLTTQEGFYRLDVILPPDDITVTVKLVRLTHHTDIVGLPPYDGVKRAYMTASMPALRSDNGSE